MGNQSSSGKQPNTNTKQNNLLPSHSNNQNQLMPQPSTEFTKQELQCLSRYFTQLCIDSSSVVTVYRGSTMFENGPSNQALPKGDQNIETSQNIYTSQITALAEFGSTIMEPQQYTEMRKISKLGEKNPQQAQKYELINYKDKTLPTIQQQITINSPQLNPSYQKTERKKSDATTQYDKTNQTMNQSMNINMDMDMDMDMNMDMNIKNETKYEIFYKNVMKVMGSLIRYKYDKDFVAEVTHIFNCLNQDQSDFVLSFYPANQVIGQREERQGESLFQKFAHIFLEFIRRVNCKVHQQIDLIKAKHEAQIQQNNRKLKILIKTLQQISNIQQKTENANNYNLQVAKLQIQNLKLQTHTYELYMQISELHKIISRQKQQNHQLAEHNKQQPPPDPTNTPKILQNSLITKSQQQQHQYQQQKQEEVEKQQENNIDIDIDIDITHKQTQKKQNKIKQNKIKQQDDH